MIHPIQLEGLWDEGYALDIYTVSSTYLGEGPFGNPMYDTVRTEIGQLLYSFKYNGHLDTRDQIATAATPFLLKWLKDKNISAVLPCPSSKERYVQPVVAISEAIAQELGIHCVSDVLEKRTSLLTKDLPKDQRDLSGSIVQTKPARMDCNVLLIDDLFDTGATANECVRVLQLDPHIKKVYFLAVAKNRK